MRSRRSRQSAFGVRRGMFYLGPWVLDLQGLGQMLLRPGCWGTALGLVLFVVVLGIARPWELLRKWKTVQVLAPPAATWQLPHASGQGDGRAQVHAGNQVLTVDGSTYFPREIELQIPAETTPTIVLADALQWLSTPIYTDTLSYLLWPRPRLLDLPQKVCCFVFPGPGPVLVYQARDLTSGNAWRVYQITEQRQQERLAWIEAIGELWALAPDGRVAVARGGQVSVAESLGQMTEVYTSSQAVLDLQRLQTGWLAITKDNYGGYRFVRIGDDGAIQVLASVGKQVRIVGETETGILVRMGGGLYLLDPSGELTLLGEAYEGNFPGVLVADDGYVYWVGLDPSVTPTPDTGPLRAAWRASYREHTPAQMVTRGVDIAGLLAVRSNRLYYVIARSGDLQIARKNADGSGKGEVLGALGIGATEVWPSPDLRLWVIQEATKKNSWQNDNSSSRFRVLDFGRIEP